MELLSLMRVPVAPGGQLSVGLPSEVSTVSICCRGCGYTLDGLPEHRCPECGRTFDPRDPATFKEQVAWWRRVVVRRQLGGAIVGAAVGTAGICAVHHPTGDAGELAVCFLSAPMLLIALICGFNMIVAGLVMELGSAFLYSFYSFVLFTRRGWRRRVVWLIVIATVHGVSLWVFVQIMTSLAASVRAVAG